MKNLHRMLTEDEWRTGFQAMTLGERKAMRDSVIDIERMQILDLDDPSSIEHVLSNWLELETEVKQNAKLLPMAYERARAREAEIKESANFQRAYERAEARNADLTARVLWKQWHSARTILGIMRSRKQALFIPE